MLGRSRRGGGLAAVLAGLALGACVGMVLLARQAAPRAVALAYADPDYMDWLDSAGLAEGLTPTNPVELPLGMYYAKARCSRPPCGCCGDPYVFEGVDPADVPSPEQEVIENYKLPAGEVNLYKKAWNGFDGRRAGKVPTCLSTGEKDLRPLAKLVRTLGTNPRDSDLEYTIGQVDPDCQGIDYPEFLLTMARHAPAWPVAVSESLATPLSVNRMKDPATQSRFKKAISAAADVLPSKVSIVRVRPAPGRQGSIVDVNVDASSDDMELMQSILTTDNINQNLQKFSLPEISKGPEVVRGVESITLPQSAASITGAQQDAIKGAIAGVISEGLTAAGYEGVDSNDISIVRIQGVNGRPEEASVDVGVEAENEDMFGLVKRALQPSAIREAFAKAGLETPSDSELVTLPVGFTPGCARCMSSPYMDGDDLGKDWVGNSPFDRPLSRYQAEEVHRFDSDKPVCECDDDRR